jgi:hypothetical protein
LTWTRRNGGTSGCFSFVSLINFGVFDSSSFGILKARLALFGSITMQLVSLMLTTTWLLAACASGPPKLPSCDGSSLRPINPGYAAEAQPASNAAKTGATAKQP